MELRDYFKIIRRHIAVFLAVVILTTGFALIFSKTRPTSYTASTTFTVNKGSSLKQSQVNYYLFDNYYNVQSAGLFSQIVSTWFESPSLVRDIYKEAGIDVPNVSQKALSSTFRAVREDPAIINVSISGQKQEELDKLLNAAYTVLQSKTDQLGRADDKYFEIARFNPIVTKDEPNIPLNTIIGLISGALIGALLCLAIAYFKQEK